MSENRKPAIEVKNLTKSFRIPLEKGRSVKSKILGRSKKGYREFTPLNDISFTVYEGDFFGIVGRNGSGKSTLLKTIAGIYEPTKGKVSVSGTIAPFIELGVGFNPQLTGRDNVYLNAAMLGFSREETDGMYDDIVDFAELHDFMEERLQNYSSGMQVRLAFSVAIRAKGAILLLDEVLAVGDASFQQKCFNYFDQLKREKKTVVLVTHSMSNIERFCNRALLLDSGEIKAIGTGDSIANEYNSIFKSLSESKKISGSKKGSDDKGFIITKITQYGTRTSTVKAGDSFTINITYGVSGKITAPDILVVMKSGDGIQMMSTNVAKLLDRRPPVLDGKTYECNVRVDNVFTNGNYTLIVKLNGGDGAGGRVTHAFSEEFFLIEGMETHAYSLVHPNMEAFVKEG